MPDDPVRDSRPAIYVGLLIAAAGVTSTFVIEKFVHDWIQAATAGLVVSLFLTTIELRHTLSETAASHALLNRQSTQELRLALSATAESSALLSRESTERLIKHLRIEAA